MLFDDWNEGMKTAKSWQFQPRRKQRNAHSWTLILFFYRTIRGVRREKPKLTLANQVWYRAGLGFSYSCVAPYHNVRKSPYGDFLVKLFCIF